MERLTDEQLAEIRKRAEKASDGPWEIGGHGDKIYDADYEPVAYDVMLDANAEFIAASRQDVPKLLAEIERLRADQERLISELKKADQISEEFERKYMAAKWPEVMADINEYVARKRRELHGGNI